MIFLAAQKKAVAAAKPGAKFDAVEKRRPPRFERRFNRLRAWQKPKGRL